MAGESEENDSIQEMLNLQLSEIEILQSMFTAEKELNVDHASLAEIQDFLSGDASVLTPNRIAFTLNLFLNVQSNAQDCLEVKCCLPQRYPHEIPEVFVQCSSLTRELQKELNESVAKFLSSLERGELCVVTIIQWLQETWPEFYERSKQVPKLLQHNKTRNKEGDNKQNLSRLWLYMHHIYSKTKRKHIIDWAVESKLTGFSLPGKPGVVCIEGDVRDTEEYFSQLRRLNWKKITCRHREESIGERRFGDFKELVFQVHGAADDRMNMGEFFQFLVKHDLREIFKILFGIEGKMTSHC